MATQDTNVSAKSTTVRAFEENILDGFDNASYNLKFYMIPESDFIAGKTSSENEIIIAESGITGQVEIQSLNIETFVAPGKSTKNVYTSEITFDIREYAGVSLMDSIYLASKSLGIRNYMKCPYFIEVSFVGYENLTGKPALDSLSNHKFTWPITISGVESEVDAGGSYYHITAYPNSDVSIRSEQSRIDSVINLQSVETVGDAIQKLIEELNLREFRKSVAATTLPDVFDIEIADSLSKLKLVAEDSTVTSQKGNTEAGTNPNVTDIPINKGASITEAINEIIIMSEQYQAESRNAKSSSSEVVEKPDAPKKMHTVATESKYLEYDSKRNEYQMVFKYKVSEYKHNTILTDTSDQNAKSKKRFDDFMSRKILQKEYNYIFTGKNDQVLNFDMKFNFAWYANIPVQAGLQTEADATNDPGQFITEQFQVMVQLREEINRASDLVAKAKTPEAKQSAASAAIAETSAKIQQSALSDEEKSQIESLLNATINARLPAPIKKVVDRAKSNKFKFANDFINEESVAASNLYRSKPITFKSKTTKKTGAVGVTQNRGSGRQQVSAMFEQAFAGKTGDLVDVTINIKGDPYWLGDPLNEKPVDSPEMPSDRARFFDAQNMILFNVRTARLPNEMTGIYNQGSTTISGVYGVRQVDHEFSEGKFTQVLHCILDPLVDLSEIDKSDL